MLLYPLVISRGDFFILFLMNQYTRYEITFGEEGEDPRFAKVQSLQLSKRIKEEIVAIWPTG